MLHAERQEQLWLWPEGRRSTWPEWDARSEVTLFWHFLGFFPPERPHQVPVFLKYQTDHTQKRLHSEELTCWCGDRKQVKTAPSQENHFCVSPQSRILHFQVFFCNLDWHFYDFIFPCIHLRQVQMVLFILLEIPKNRIIYSNCYYSKLSWGTSSF